jgi:hypothetical protein
MAENKPLNFSIHPRNWLGGGPVKDTSRPWKGGGKLQKKYRRLQRRVIEHAATLKSLKQGKTPPEAFKQPGSLNQHK